MTLTLETRRDPGPRWPAMVARFGGGFYHEPAWMRALSDALALPLHVLIAQDGGEPVGGLALMEVPALFGRRRLVSLPFSYAAGPLVRDAAALTALASGAVAIARAAGARRVELKWWPPVAGAAGLRPPADAERPLGSPPDAPDALDAPVAPDGATPDGLAALGFRRAARYATYRVAPGPEAELWRRLDRSSTQRGVRKAEREGTRVEVADDAAAWAAMAALQARTSHRHGLPAPPAAFFVDACRALQASGHARLYVARTPDRSADDPAAGVVVWRGPGAHIYAFGADDPAARERRPMHALLWRAMRDAATEGAVFDLGRAAPEQASLVQFKERWGGAAVPLAYDMWPGVGGLQGAARDGRAARAFAAVWRRLPAATADRGATLYRYLG